MKFLIQAILVFSVHTVPTLDTIPLPDILAKIDSLNTGDTITQLHKCINQYRKRVDSLQSLPIIYKQDVYIAIRNLSLSQATLYQLIAKKNPNRAPEALEAANGFKRKALVYTRKADSIRVSQTPDVQQRIYIRRYFSPTTPSRPTD